MPSLQVTTPWASATSRGAAAKRESAFLRCLKVLTACSVLAVSVQRAFPQSRTYVQDFLASIPAFRDSISRVMGEKKVPGLSVAVVDGNTILWSEGFGVTDTLRGIPIAPNTNFGIQSMSKTFTALAVLTAVWDGLLELDAPITNYVPEFTVHSRFEKAPEKKMTLRLLLSHKAGFTHEAPIGNNNEINKNSFEDHINSISETWLRYPVGERYSYSNLGIDLAGYILQRKAGIPFHRYVQERVLNPIGMTNSTFDLERIQRMPDRALGHIGKSSTPPVGVPMIPAGGMYSNVLDLARFIQLNLNNGAVDGRQVFPRELLAEMRKIPLKAPRQTEGYGLGLAIASRYNTQYFNHGGGGFGFLSTLLWYPAFNLGIAVLANSRAGNVNWYASEMITKRLVDLKMGPIEIPEFNLDSLGKAKIILTGEQQKKYLGQYLYNRGGYMLLEWQDSCVGVNPGPTFSPLNFLSGDECYILFGKRPSFYKFVLGPDGIPRIVIRMVDGEYLDLNEQPNEPAGIYDNKWDVYLGKYNVVSFSGIPRPIEVKKKNGYLYVEHMKLTEYMPGLFFTAGGEAFDLRTDPPTLANIKLQKIAGQ